ncbi:MAG TPA: right-handed parallel beta-helix repeat-containing protein [Myxococcales bacterium]
MRSAIALLAFLPCLASAATYEVGPGQPLANVGDVPWESLNAGDTVLIHWRSTSYKEKFVLCRQGMQAAPIVVRGVLGPNGERPVIDGDGATTRSALDFWGEERGVIKIGGANKPADLMPQWIVLENLDVTSGRPPFQFTGRNGLTAYAQNAAAIYVEKGENLTLRNCVIRDSGNGLFAGSQTKDLLVEGNDLRDNGNSGSIYEHNNYTAAVGITFQYNRFRPLRAGCSGNNLKDRSVGTVIRYNWIEGGNRNLDLVDAEDDPTLTGDPRYRQTFVYGNVLIKPDGGNSQVVHYGGDSGNTTIYRKGTLYFFNNTLVSTRAGNTTLLRLSTNEERADVRNNVLYVTGSGSSLGIVDSTGVVDLWSNWTKPGWVNSHSGLQGTLTDQGGAVSGSAPGFADEAGGDYHLAAGSACLDQGASLNAAVLPDHPLDLQYLPHQGFEPRPSDGPLDLGAFERCASAACTLPDAGAPMPPDAATPAGPDASTPPDLDASVAPELDASVADSSALPGVDAEAGSGPDAASPPAADAAVADASTPVADASLPPGAISSSCGCGAPGAAVLPPMWTLVAWLFVGARRRRPMP